MFVSAACRPWDSEMDRKLLPQWINHTNPVAISLKTVFQCDFHFMWLLSSLCSVRQVTRMEKQNCRKHVCQKGENIYLCSFLWLMMQSSHLQNIGFFKQKPLPHKTHGCFQVLFTRWETTQEEPVIQDLNGLKWYLTAYGPLRVTA